MKAYFLTRSARERLLLIALAAIACGIVWRSVARRTQRLRDEHAALSAEQAVQDAWFAKSADLEARAAETARTFESAKMFNPARLVAELNGLFAQTGLVAEIGSQRSEQNGSLAFHSVQVTCRGAELGRLVAFYRALGARAPYLTLEQATLALDRANPGKLSATFRVSAPEIQR
jgi:hypothetical protein